MSDDTLADYLAHRLYREAQDRKDWRARCYRLTSAMLALHFARRPTRDMIERGKRETP